jgi:hypothetical protein
MPKLPNARVTPLTLSDAYPLSRIHAASQDGNRQKVCPSPYSASKTPATATSASTRAKTRSSQKTRPIQKPAIGTSKNRSPAAPVAMPPCAGFTVSSTASSARTSAALASVVRTVSPLRATAERKSTATAVGAISRKGSAWPAGNASVAILRAEPSTTSQGSSKKSRASGTASPSPATSQIAATVRAARVCVGLAAPAMTIVAAKRPAPPR